MQQNEESVGYGTRSTAPQKGKSLAAEPSINQLKCRHILTVSIKCYLLYANRSRSYITIYIIIIIY